LNREEMLLRQEKVRACLHCGREFWSGGPWNRLCEQCTKDQPVVSRVFDKHKIVVR